MYINTDHSILIVLLFAISIGLFLYRTSTSESGSRSRSPCVHAFQSESRIDDTIIKRLDDSIQRIFNFEYNNSTISHHFFTSQLLKHNNNNNNNINLNQWNKNKKVDEKEVAHHIAIIRDTLSDIIWNDETLIQLKEQYYDSSSTSTSSTSTSSMLATTTNSNNKQHSNNIRVMRDTFDEIYIMRPEFDFVDDDKIHYDGILKIPGLCTVRTLTYISGKPATLVTLTSGKNYTTEPGTSIILDFDRELHFVKIGNDNQDDDGKPRVMIKSALHIASNDINPILFMLHVVAHRIVFFIIKSGRNTFEAVTNNYDGIDETTTTISNKFNNFNHQKLMMISDNIFRCLNKVHMILPILIVVVPISISIIALVIDPLQFVPHVIHIILYILLSWLSTDDDDGNGNDGNNNVLTISNINSNSSKHNGKLAMTLIVLRVVFFVFIIYKHHCVQISKRRKRIPTFLLLLTHFVWIGFFIFARMNAEMATKILFAPFPKVIQL